MPRTRIARPTKGKRLVFLEVADTDADRAAWYDANLACTLEDCFGTVLPFGALTPARRKRIESRLHRERWHPQRPERGYPENACYWLVREGHRIGTAGLIASSHRTHQGIAGLYVRPEDRGRGYATEALAVMEQAARRAHFEGIRLDTDWCFGTLAGLYLRLGFHVRHWKENLTLIRPGKSSPITLTQEGDVAILAVEGESAPRLRARRGGERLLLEGCNTVRCPSTGAIDDAAEERLATFALFLATRGFPLIRSAADWEGARLRPESATPEALGRCIVRWEANARHWGEVVNTPRIPGLPYRTRAQLDAPPAVARLRARLHDHVQERGGRLVRQRWLGRWDGFALTDARRARVALALVSIEGPSNLGEHPPDRPNGVAIPWLHLAADRPTAALWRGWSMRPCDGIVDLGGDAPALDLDLLYDGVDLDPMSLAPPANELPTRP